MPAEKHQTTETTRKRFNFGSNHRRTPTIENDGARITYANTNRKQGDSPTVVRTREITINIRQLRDSRILFHKYLTCCSLWFFLIHFLSVSTIKTFFSATPTLVSLTALVDLHGVQRFDALECGQIVYWSQSGQR